MALRACESEHSHRCREPLRLGGDVERLRAPAGNECAANEPRLLWKQLDGAHCVEQRIKIGTRLSGW